MNTRQRNTFAAEPRVEVPTWHQKQAYCFDPVADISTTTDIPNTFIMHAGAFSAVLSRTDTNQHSWRWKMKMTFGGETECLADIGTTTASETEAKAEAFHVFRQWIHNLTVYAPHALNMLNRNSNGQHGTPT